ncbi:MAG TPA: response regulator transcription factor [Candidatus Limnocylindrales bacterium]|jgi:DNA-binding NarL/FixJ family response regulator|nr:response regulator transcription factor [Candidatus Limnocylindrales bacterium]
MPDTSPALDGPLRVLVVDADDRVRESLAGLLAIGDRLTVIGSAGQPGSAFDLACAQRPDVVIVDPRLPEVDGGLDFIRRLRAADPDVCVLVMGWTDTLETALGDGCADGFLRKTFRPAELISAIVQATAGRDRPDPDG